MHTFQLTNYTFLNFSSNVWGDQLIIFGGCSRELRCTSDLVLYDLMNNSKRVFDQQFFADKQ